MIQLLPVTIVVPMPPAIGLKFLILFQGVVLAIKEILTIKFYECEKT